MQVATFQAGRSKQGQVGVVREATRGEADPCPTLVDQIPEQAVSTPRAIPLSRRRLHFEHTESHRY